MESAKPWMFWPTAAVAGVSGLGSYAITIYLYDRFETLQRVQARQGKRNDELGTGRVLDLVSFILSSAGLGIKFLGCLCCNNKHNDNHQFFHKYVGVPGVFLLGVGPILALSSHSFIIDKWDELKNVLDETGSQTILKLSIAGTVSSGLAILSGIIAIWMKSTENNSEPALQL